MQPVGVLAYSPNWPNPNHQGAIQMIEAMPILSQTSPRVMGTEEYLRR
jgi:hypothetical protein